jgi:hypothetical protein
MSNGIVWEPIRKFPGYEVSKNHLIRNSKTKRIVSQRVDRFDREQRPKVVLVRQERAVEVFVQEIVYSTFGGTLAA